MPRRTIGIPGIITTPPTNRLAMPTGRVPGSLRFTVRKPRQGPKQLAPRVLASCRSCRTTFRIPARAAWPHDPWWCALRRERQRWEDR